ncbi:MAG: c-type cytochrome [Actinomycetota bacterium]
MSDPEEATIREDPALRQSLRRWQEVGAGVLLLLAVAFPLYRAVESTRRSDASAAREEALISTGRQLWGLNCAACHGVDGAGVNAPALNSEEFLQTVSDQQIHNITAAGIPGTEMPAWWNELGGALTDEQIVAIIAYLRSWEDTAPSRPDWRTASEGQGG